MTKQAVKEVDDPKAAFREVARRRIAAAEKLDAALDGMVDAVRRYLAVGAEAQAAGVRVGMEAHVVNAGRTAVPAIHRALALTGLHEFGTGLQGHHLSAAEADRSFFAAWIGPDGEEDER